MAKPAEVDRWPRVAWWRPRPMRWWWSTPLAGAVAWFVVWVALGLTRAERPVAESVVNAMGGAVFFLVVGIPIAFARYQRWLNAAAERERHLGS